MKNDAKSSDNGEREMTLAEKTRQIVIAIGSYWTVSIAMVFINKYLLSSSELKFDAPLFVTWFQCIFSVITYLVLRYIKDLRPNSLKFFPKFELEPNQVQQVFPLALVFVSMIAFNNLSLKYVAVSFYMIVRSLSTVFNVILVYIYFGDRTSMRAIGCCAIITVGFILGIQQEQTGDAAAMELNGKGIFFGVLSSFFAALNGVYIKKTISVVDNNIWKLNFITNIYASVIFLPLIWFAGETENIFSFPGLTDSYFWFCMSVSGFMGFMIGYVTSRQVQVTSPLTHNISGTTKSYIQTVLGVVVYHEVKTMLWWTSNFFVLIGAGLYSHVRTKEMKQKHHEDDKKKEGERRQRENLLNPNNQNNERETV